MAYINTDDMKRKLINQNWNEQRDITPDMFTLKNKHNAEYLNHLRDVHELTMQDLIDHCRMNVIWVPSRRDFDNKIQ